ncbi:MAG TPA: hypothetical protein VF109_00940, partial [Mycobacteriales bacterium]
MRPKLPSRFAALAGVLTLLATFGVSLLQDLVKDVLPQWAVYVVIGGGLVAYAVGWWIRRPAPATRRTPDTAFPEPVDLVGRDEVVRTGVARLAASRQLLVHGPRNIGTSEVAL